MGRWRYITPDPEIEEAPVTSIVKQFMKVCHDSSLEQTVKLLIQISYLPFLLPALTFRFFFRGYTGKGSEIIVNNALYMIHGWSGIWILRLAYSHS